MRKQLLWLLRKLLPRPAIRRYRTSAGRCVYCGYDLAADGRNPNYCPQCGNSQLQEAHSLRRRELMLELERLQMELVAIRQESAWPGRTAPGTPVRYSAKRTPRPLAIALIRCGDLSATPANSPPTEGDPRSLRFGQRRRALSQRLGRNHAT